MKTVTIDGADFENSRKIHEYLADRLDFPPYYGKNMDALFDVLSQPGFKVRFVLKNTEKHPAFFKGLKKIMHELDIKGEDSLV